MASKQPETLQKKPHSTLEWLCGRVEAYLAKNPHITPPGFGLASVQDTNLVKRLRAGHDVTTRKFDALVRYMGNPNEKEAQHGKIEKQKGNGKKVSARKKG